MYLSGAASEINHVHFCTNPISLDSQPTSHKLREQQRSPKQLETTLNPNIPVTEHGFQLQLWGPLVGACFFSPFQVAMEVACKGSLKDLVGWWLVGRLGGLCPIEWGISWSKNGASLSFEFRVLCPNLVGHIHRIGPWKKRNPRNFGPLWVVDVVEEIRYFT